MSGFFEPEGNQIRCTGNSLAIYLSKCLDVSVTQAAPHFLSTQEWWVADDAIHFRPFGFSLPAIRITGQDGIVVLDIIELAQNRFSGPTDAVLIEPLQIANPDHY